MIKKNLEIRDKLINKLFIKIENLNNDIILLSKIDKKIFENTINQKGGNNTNLALLNLYNIKNKIKKDNTDINIFTKLIKTIAYKRKQLLNFFTTLTTILENIKLIEEKNIFTNYKEITTEDIEVLFEYLNLTNKKDAYTNVPKYKQAINKIGKTTFIYFLKTHKYNLIKTSKQSPSTSPSTTPSTTPSISPLPSPKPLPRTISTSPRSPSSTSPLSTSLSQKTKLFLDAAKIATGNEGTFDEFGDIKKLKEKK